MKTFLGIPWWSSGEDLVPSWLRPRSYPWLGNENLISPVVWPKKKKIQKIFLSSDGENVNYSVTSNSLQPHGLYSLPGSSVNGILQVSILECPTPGDLPDPGNEPRSPAVQAESFTV